MRILRKPVDNDAPRSSAGCPQVLPLPPTNRTRLLRAGPALLRSAVPLPAPRDHRAVAGGANAHGCRQPGTNGQLAAIAGSHALGRRHSLHRRVASRRVGPIGPRRYRASDWGSAHPNVKVPQIPPGAAIADRQRRAACLSPPTPLCTIRYRSKCSVAVLGAPRSSRVHGCWLGSGHQPPVGRRGRAGCRRPSTTCPRYQAQLRSPGPDALVSRRRRRPVQPATPGDLHGACLDRVDRPLPALVPAMRQLASDRFELAFGDVVEEVSA